jgi:uncharacterized protein YcgL (UPF0745 family)
MSRQKKYTDSTVKNLFQTIPFTIAADRKVGPKQVNAGNYVLKKFRKGTNTYLEVTKQDEEKRVPSMRAVMFGKICEIDPKFRREDPLVKDVTNQVLSTMLISYLSSTGELNSDS